MIEIFGSIAKAAVGLAIETPIAIVADVVTLGGTLSDKALKDNETYTGAALSKIVKNVEDATK